MTHGGGKERGGGVPCRVPGLAACSRGSGLPTAVLSMSKERAEGDGKGGACGTRKLFSSRGVLWPERGGNGTWPTVGGWRRVRADKQTRNGLREGKQRGWGGGRRAQPTTTRGAVRDSQGTQAQTLSRVSHDPVHMALPSGVTPRHETRSSWPSRTRFSLVAVSHTRTL